MNSNRFKLLTASLGTGALLAMGAVSVATTTVAQDDENPVTPGPVTTSEITTGETITETVAPEAPETTAAVPPITTTPETVSTGELH
ncbi:Uncharacterised protein [Mycolicibacterium phlei]|uniref:Uncharacterized protein n=1 Tax=Mycolicibacterium phlei DSM 43239 = CCUG 21000 TaxID=1226750 RepID=A0A5N5V248_MYCPH|nr:hypothetical protein [Mycolicibacterium phlei]VEG10859.1 Uncharacterised protein [Mycobacteroides chelonae]AMO62758.1 hypothetical protein MPHLCCUG_03970 [Mycolicibacterium phlei]EID14456.1 hypothetical protein MPHLEI_11355 [Mycolicibacterium phlei RIVM601174]KAB7755972.1 hypothetical protein MPHL21000_12810 [Mycolicibacterium phlei DSM 43239 = CCUG 21000]KXW65930.1 hypothetical protein MPHL43239_09360 [Mycolicibacterium phlei DSM 43239 = CCUG 21000]